jgi:hypothetical protein
MPITTIGTAQTVVIPQSSTMITSITCMTVTYTIHIAVMWMSIRSRSAQRILTNARRTAAAMSRDTSTDLGAGMKLYRTATTLTIS